MKQVYLIECVEYDYPHGTHIVAAFASEESAKQYLADVVNCDDDDCDDSYYIACVEVLP